MFRLYCIIDRWVFPISYVGIKVDGIDMCNCFECYEFYFSVPPLFVIEFLHRVVDTFEDYFSECTESIIKEHYVVVYEVRMINHCSYSNLSFHCMQSGCFDIN